MKSKKAALPYFLWMIIFTLIPQCLIIYYAFTDNNGSFSLEPFKNTFGYMDIFLHSLWIALISTAICLLIAYPLAYLMTKMKKSRQSLMVMLIMIPMWLNFLLRIYAWVLLLQNNGPIDRFLNLFGIDATLSNNTGAVVLGMVYEFLPFMILPIYNVMCKIDHNLVEAAQDLGSNGFNVFRKVIFPLSIPGIVSGITMVFVPTASTFLVSQYLGGADDMMIGDVIEKVFQNDRHTGSAISLLLMMIILMFIIIMNQFGDEEAVGV